eukprot:3037995-Rhodomonas_salina.1
MRLLVSACTRALHATASFAIRRRVSARCAFVYPHSASPRAHTHFPTEKWGGAQFGIWEQGPNGQGKSTLLRFLAQKELPVPADMRVVLVEQSGLGQQQARASSARFDSGLTALVLASWVSVEQEGESDERSAI